VKELQEVIEYDLMAVTVLPFHPRPNLDIYLSISRLLSSQECSKNEWLMAQLEQRSPGAQE
jgi:hypothetical protein